MTSPEVELSLENATLNFQLPKQDNDVDCGLFVCCHAIDYWSNAEEFSAPVKPQLRNEINAVLMEIITARAKFEDKKPIKSLHPILIEFMAVLEQDQETDPHNTIEMALAKVVSANADLHPKKYKPRKTHYSSDLVTKKKSLFKTRQLFEDNPKEAFNSIMPCSAPCSTPPMADIISHYTKDIPPPVDTFFNLAFTFYEDRNSHEEITVEEIERVFSSTHKSAPDFDKITFADWLALDPDHLFLLELFNLILKSKCIPQDWKSYKTTLIIKSMKSSQSHLINSWRPIAVLNTTYRLFATVMNNRLLDWVTDGGLMSRNQKALLASDGCAEHNSTLQILKENALAEKTELHACWFDLADAFPSVPHDLIWHILGKMGLQSNTIQLFKNMYC